MGEQEQQLGDEVALCRKQLIELLGAFSEERYAAGWMIGIDRIAFREGGVWEILARAIGWPLGFEAAHGWASWEEADSYYRDLEGARGG